MYSLEYIENIYSSFMVLSSSVAGGGRITHVDMCVTARHGRRLWQVKRGRNMKPRLVPVTYQVQRDQASVGHRADYLVELFTALEVAVNYGVLTICCMR